MRSKPNEAFLLGVKPRVRGEDFSVFVDGFPQHRLSQCVEALCVQAVRQPDRRQKKGKKKKKEELQNRTTPSYIPTQNIIFPPRPNDVDLVESDIVQTNERQRAN